MKNLFLSFLFLFVCFSAQFADAVFQESSSPVLNSAVLKNNSASSLSAEEISSYLRQSLEEQKKIREIEKEMAHLIESHPLKIAYTLFYDHEKESVCYVEAFGREDIVPDFAEPADYDSADLAQRPDFPKCSKEEEALIRYYRDHSYLHSVDTAGGPLVAPLLLCAVPAGFGYLSFSKEFKGTEKEWKELLRQALYSLDISSLEDKDMSDEEFGAFLRSAIEKERQAWKEEKDNPSSFDVLSFYLFGWSILSSASLLMTFQFSSLSVFAPVAPVCLAIGMSFSIIHVDSSAIVNDIDRVEPLSP